MMTEHFLNVLEIESAQFYYFYISPVIGRHKLGSFFLSVNIYYEPGFMFSIKTTLIYMGKKMKP